VLLARLPAPLKTIQAARMSFEVRPAIEADQPGILALVRSERLNPNNLAWRNFVVASDETGISGAVQIRNHADGSQELGSLVVRREARGHGVASRLVEAITARDNRRLFMITGAAFATHFERWDFRPIDPNEAPRAIRHNYRMGRLGGILSLLRWRRPRRLVILDRPGRGAGVPDKLERRQAETDHHRCSRCWRHRCRSGFSTIRTVSTTQSGRQSGRCRC
jgi:amino-acid N-acetyltransferase